MAIETAVAAAEEALQHAVREAETAQRLAEEERRKKYVR
jgi:hypothetical protein